MILEEIAAKKRETLQKREYKFDVSRFVESWQSYRAENFKNALTKPGLSIIGEVKKASPSKGLIRPDFQPVEIAREYENAVEALSVLTEEHYFQGSPLYLKEIHQAVSLPILRKDFIISPLQIFEAFELGASAILLIVALLNEDTLFDYIDIAKGLNLSVLVEVHSKEELFIALSAGAEIIGINNRNLKDFSEDITTTLRLREYIPEGKVVVSESGIRSEADISLLKDASVDAVLVGEGFMRAGSIREMAVKLKNAYCGTEN